MDPVRLEKALEKKCRNRLWLAWMFFLASTPGTLTSMHITSYVFLGGDPPFFCDVPELRGANWTSEQIKTISSPGTDNQSCTVYAWNYTLLKELGFQEAATYCNATKKPDVVKCNSYIYEEETPHQTIVSQWDLVCDNLPQRRAAQVGVALGKFFGAFIFGILADRYGRKRIFVLSCLLFIAVGPAGAFVENYLFFIVLRILVGVASSGLYEAGYTILSELTVKNYRAWTTCLYNVPYSFGFVLLPMAAYLTDNWRQLQLAISVPTVLVLFHCWFLPESPRWLVTRGKLEKASVIIGSNLRLHHEGHALRLNAHEEKSHRGHKKFIAFFKGYFKLFSTLELSKRMLICYFGWFVANFNYFAIIMSGTNFTVNEYLYMALNGIVEAPSYMLPPLMLMYLGRKSTSMTLFAASGFAVIAIMFVPQGWPVTCMAVIGRLAAGTVFIVMALQTSELIPTEHRNSAVGSSLAVAQLGVMAAPLIVDKLGKMAWWLPSTLCGCLSLVAAFFLLFIPETRDAAMLDTLTEMHEQEKQNLNKADESAS